MENNKKTANIGVAAHICAAAEGGPRYDKNMTTEERRSIENCIWMCQTHAKLIDSDEKTYTVGKLKQWKAEAEEASAKALASSDFFTEYYNNNGENLDVLQQLLEDMIIDGNFRTLHTMLDQYETPLSDKYEEIALRFKIIFDVYCNRSKLEKDLDEYCGLPCKSGVDILIKLFISFHLFDELCKIIGFCESEELRRFAKMALDDQLTEYLTGPIGSNKTVDIPVELNEMISKYIANHFVLSKIAAAVDVTGAKYELFSKEFYYRVIKALHEISYAVLYEKATFEETITSDDFLFLKNHINEILQLDFSLQKYIWKNLLAFLSGDKKLFESYYEKCPEELRTLSSIKRARYIYEINFNVNQIDERALLEYVVQNDENLIMCMYLSRLENNLALQFLGEHGFLYRRNSIYIKLRLELDPSIQPEEALAIIEKFETTYPDDFTFHLLLAKYCNDEETLKKEIEWLSKRKLDVSVYDVFDYITVLSKGQCWSDLIELSERNLPNECLFVIANRLAESNDIDNKKVSLNLYQKLVGMGWRGKGLYFNLGVLQKQCGNLEAAKKSLQMEFDLYEDVGSLNALLQLRFMLYDYTTDMYFEQLKTCIDANSQNLVGAIYLKRRNYTDARKYFLRSLLLNDYENPSLIGFYHAASQLPNEEITTVKENVFLTIKNSTKCRHIAVHEADVMNNIATPNRLANYEHYSIEDSCISSMFFAKQGDTVSFEGEAYEISEIVSANTAVTRFFFSKLGTQEDVTTIKTSSAEELREQLTIILKESSKNLKRHIDEYNNLKIRSPLALLAKLTGKGMLKTSEFLAFENQAKIRNNLGAMDALEGKYTFVLSYDSIVYLTHLGIDYSALSSLNVVCPQQVKNQLQNDINEEYRELTDEHRKGTMFYKDGNLSLFEQTPDMRRARLALLTRLNGFLNSLPVEENTCIFSSNNNGLKEIFEGIFSKEELYCESSILGIVQNITNAVLVTDDQFLYAIAKEEGLKNIGLTGLLEKVNLSWEKLLTASKTLKEMNYENYLPVHLYKRIVDQMIASESDTNVGSEKIQKWVISDTDGAPSSQHEDIAIALYRDVVMSGFNYLNPEHYLTDVAIAILENRNPGFLQKCVDEAFGSLMSMEDDFSENI